MTSRGQELLTGKGPIKALIFIIDPCVPLSIFKAIFSRLSLSIGLSKAGFKTTLSFSSGSKSFLMQTVMELAMSLVI